MKIIAIEKDAPGAPVKTDEDLLRQEAARVWELTQAGSLREAYFRADRTSAVLVLECATSNEAAALLDSLPLVQAGAIIFELIPLRAYPGFARLFGATPVEEKGSQ